MISRDDFESSCKDFVEKHATSNDNIFGGWSWNEHAYLPRLGYLSRKKRAHTFVNVTNDAEDDFDVVAERDGDTATASIPPEDSLLEVWQYTVYSATFQVPALYFSMHTTSGSPLSLDGILASSLFRRNVFPNAQKTGFALQTPSNTFPLLSQGEHPTLGTPCWFFHPCETPSALAELVQADGNADVSSARILELWLLLVGNVINFQEQ
ncbi:uncharacterized protein FOMMEDRAFT_169476 [Fomitiporia mediterranea MF3/22]|uniref:uncharacterized protein n=1 Tax=Fomitiporia mediterranea (strain MF3/22) TaxID=694068 RepID=UPI0004408693|nr:uncharacterized protein FOMMEDRAFT_169476 [Fomitiporia mediterranea MF3/22]EJD01335.1 hypothetical protein FOMMEDRAFT_169476 [Fomitiporia mediterranea MF3/22]